MKKSLINLAVSHQYLDIVFARFVFKQGAERLAGDVGIKVLYFVVVDAALK